MRTFIETIDNDIELKAQGPDIAALNAARGISGDIEVLCTINRHTGKVYIDKGLLNKDAILQAITEFTERNIHLWAEEYPAIYKGKQGMDHFESFYF